jgi:hypothetical protein
MGGWLWLLSHYCDSLAHNSRKTILTIGTIGFVVKTSMNQDFKVDDTFAYFIFIELSNSSLGENLPPLLLLSKLPKGILHYDVFLSSKPSTPMGSI